MYATNTCSTPSRARPAAEAGAPGGRAHLEVGGVGGGVDDLLAEAHVLRELVALLQARLHRREHLLRDLRRQVEELLDLRQLQLRHGHEEVAALEVEEVQRDLHELRGRREAQRHACSEARREAREQRQHLARVVDVELPAACRPSSEHGYRSPALSVILLPWQWDRAWGHMETEWVRGHTHVAEHPTLAPATAQQTSKPDFNT